MPRNQKRFLATALLVLFPFAAYAAGKGTSKGAPKKTADKTTAPATPDASAVKTAEGLPALEVEIQQLRTLLQTQAQELEAQRIALREQQEELRKQQARTETLEAELQLAHNGASLALAQPTADQPSAAQPSAASAQPQEGLGDRIAKVENRLKQVGPFTFSGDLRLRDEPFFGGPADNSLVRHRERYRLRFNANARLNDDLNAGLTLASGDRNDPISTNQNANQFYTRKPFAIDRAFINYNPHFIKPLTLIGGKFSYPWYNTEMTWDKDLNPEGAAQTLAWDFESKPLLKRFALVGFELPFAETAGVSLGNKSIVASAVYGGQVQTGWQLTNWLKLSAYAGFYQWHNADPVALAVLTANPASPANGLLPLDSNRNQNSVTFTVQNGIVTLKDGTTISTGVSKIVAAQFASKFGLLDTIARFDIKTPAERWPLAFLGNFVQNTEACANVGNIAAAPANTSTATFSQKTTAPCNPRERRGYWLEGRFGRAQEKGDWQLAYTRMFIEREAVLGVFNYSEIRQGSNVTQHRVEAIYQAYRNVQLSFTGFFGRPLNFGSSNPPERFLKRLQFDVLYRF